MDKVGGEGGGGGNSANKRVRKILDRNWIKIASHYVNANRSKGDLGEARQIMDHKFST